MSLQLFALRPRASNRRLKELSPSVDCLQGNMQMAKIRASLTSGGHWPLG